MPMFIKRYAPKFVNENNKKRRSETLYTAIRTIIAVVKSGGGKQNNVKSKLGTMHYNNT